MWQVELILLPASACLHGLLLDPEDGGDISLWNVGFSRNYMVLQARRPYTSHSPPSETQIQYHHIIIIVIGKTDLIEPRSISDDIPRLLPVFTSLDFATIFFSTEQALQALQALQTFFQPLTLRTKSLYLCSRVTGWPSYTPRHWFPFHRVLRLRELRWRYSCPPPQGDKSNIFLRILGELCKSHTYSSHSYTSLRHFIFPVILLISFLIP
jgi:hypothetical protein